VGSNYNNQGIHTNHKPKYPSKLHIVKSSSTLNFYPETCVNPMIV
jgi:hypothetical protein